MLNSGEVFFRWSAHPVYNWLVKNGVKPITFEPIYEIPGISFTEIYEFIVRILVMEARKSGSVTYAVPGHPLFFERTPRILKERAKEYGIDVEIVHGMSFVEVICDTLNIDPADGLRLIDANQIATRPKPLCPNEASEALLIAQLGATIRSGSLVVTDNIKAVQQFLSARYPSDHKVTLVWSTDLSENNTKTLTFSVKELSKQTAFTRTLASLYVPPIASRSPLLHHLGDRNEIVSQNEIDDALAKVNEIDFSLITNRVLQKYNWDEVKVSEIEKLYRKFLALRVTYPDVLLAPTEEIDEFWHAHILSTHRYLSDCTILFGEFFHHTPALPDTDESEKRAMIRYFQKTVRLFKVHFGIDLVNDNEVDDVLPDTLKRMLNSRNLRYLYLKLANSESRIMEFCSDPVAFAQRYEYELDCEELAYIEQLFSTEMMKGQLSPDDINILVTDKILKEYTW